MKNDLKRVNAYGNFDITSNVFLNRQGSLAWSTRINRLTIYCDQ